ncbi:hypothetical protein CLV68_3345 [Actinokineospora cianjurensis]|uniref:von Willebrand factor type A domain-containing protein n=1 Tax=Actinokineospora cianjurensis TaxID=585224 RepID=A0A421B3F9_9PSEU|nr:hypothetical protein CLV68_3345 [Actinokineospora cianjurensis]
MDEPDRPGVRNSLTNSQAETVIQTGSFRGRVISRVHRYTVAMPPAVRNSVVAVLVVALLGGVTYAVLTWVVPQFAPTYKTEFLIDLSGADSVDEVTASVESLRKALGNSGEDDAIALRAFGGECGSDDNTTQLVDFGTDNRSEIGDAARGAATGGGATLLRGIIEATQDFSTPFSQQAKQVNRIIVVTRNGVDACDDDTGYVREEIRDRVAASGLALDFRFVGYQLPAGHEDGLAALATGAEAPPPVLARDPDELKAALDWITNVEPVLRSAKQVVDVFNPTVDQLDRAVRSMLDGRLDTARRLLAEVEPVTADAEFENLGSRARTPEATALHAQAVDLRERHRRVVEVARELWETARSGVPLDQQLTKYQRAAKEYNDSVSAVNATLARLRASGPGART